VQDEVFPIEGVEGLVEDLDGHADFDVVGCDLASSSSTSATM
jgi:hypothetical protein